jgi:hypothetical protein
LSTKHVDALESSNVWVFIVMDLLHLIMIGNKKLGAGFFKTNYFTIPNTWCIEVQSQGP